MEEEDDEHDEDDREAEEGDAQEHRGDTRRSKVHGARHRGRVLELRIVNRE